MKIRRQGIAGSPKGKGSRPRFHRTLWPAVLALGLAACGGGGGGGDDDDGNLPPPAPYTKQWGTVAADAVYGVATDGNGNVYTLGTTGATLNGQTSAGGFDLVLTKYDRDGRLAWVRQFGSTGDDVAGGVTVDAQGRVIVAGAAAGPVNGAPYGGNRDVLVAAFDGNGQRLWTKQWGGSAGELAHAVAVNGSGEIFVTGQNGNALLVLKVSADGNTVTDLSRSSDSNAIGRGIAVAGNVLYLTGETSLAMDGQLHAGLADAFVTKRSTTNGAVEWTRHLGTAADEAGRGVAVDSGGNVLVTGYTFGPMGGGTANAVGDIFVAKFNASGAQQWLQRTGSAQQEAGYAIATDAQGNAYVAGHSAGAFAGTTALGNVDMVLLKYDGGGNQQWVRRLGTALGDTATSVAVDGQGRVYLGGFTQGAIDGLAALGGTDMVLARYDASGNKQ